VYAQQGIPHPDNQPGARQSSQTSVDATGDLWLFSGGGAADLWRFDMATRQWAWIKGQPEDGKGGVYGTLNVPDSTNHPGSREVALTWLNDAGLLRMFGGNGWATDTSSVSHHGVLNDV
jgi:hypothetical protein